MMAQVLELEWAEGDDRDAILACPAFNYTTQTWSESSDHAHYMADDGPLMFCGADLASCQKGHYPERWA